MICDFDGGSLGNGQRLTRTIVFAGRDTWDAVLERLEERHYHLDDDGTIFNGVRNFSKAVAGKRALGPNTAPRLTQQLAESDCAIPADGVVMVQFYQ